MNESLAPKRIKQAVAALGACLVVAAAVTPAAYALPPLPGKFAKYYIDKGIDVTPLSARACGLCHAGAPSARNINAYATDLRGATDIRATNVNFGSIEDRDSDADGATNLDEITAGTLPGDSSSKP